MKPIMLVTILAACSLWMCTETEFENTTTHADRALDRASLASHHLSLDSADTVCSTLVTAIRGLGSCKILLQTEDSLTLNPLQPHPPLVLGNQYQIGFEYRDQPSRCMMGRVILLTCIQPADSTGGFKSKK